jgi:hypothetical protein
MAEYVHRPTTPGVRRIRLIHLHPTRTRPAEDARVSCSITHVSLDHPPPYVAISYAWGDASKTRPMFIDRAIYHATENLEAGLRHLAREDETVTLWVDALCINQNDPVEKSVQVGQMGEVYSKATSVICWLGPAAENSDLAMRWVDSFGRRAFQYGIGSTPAMRLRHLLRTLKKAPDDITDGDLRAFLQELRHNLSSWVPGEPGAITGLFKLFSRSYWGRIWVVQEVVLPKTVDFQCGYLQVCEEYLNHTLRLIRNFGQYQLLDTAPDPPSDTCSSIPTLQPINLLKLRRSGGPFQLTHLVRALSTFQATDPRDRLFSLLSFASNPGVLPNYGMTPVEVYIHAATVLIKQGFLEVLSLAEGGTDDVHPDLPSWAPNLGKMRTRACLQQSTLRRATVPATTVLQPKYSASGTTSGNCAFIADGATPSAVSLSINGLRIGKVSRIGTVWESAKIGMWLSELKDVSRSIHGANPGSHLRSLLRSAVADQEIRHGHDKPRLRECVLQSLESSLNGLELGTVTDELLHTLGFTDYSYQLQDIARERRPFSVDGSRHYGIGPAKMSPGDVVFVISGVSTPFVLHHISRDTFQLLGECYVEGIMDGEAVRDNLPWENVIIV